MATKIIIEAVVSRVIDERNNRYAVTYPTGQTGQVGTRTAITFSLESDVWKGERSPVGGQIVSLSNVEKFNKGWRAQCACPVGLTATEARKEKQQ